LVTLFIVHLPEKINDGDWGRLYKTTIFFFSFAALVS
jgi:hypothetical protein